MRCPLAYVEVLFFLTGLLKSTLSYAPLLGAVVNVVVTATITIAIDSRLVGNGAVVVELVCIAGAKHLRMAEVLTHLFGTLA